MFTRIATQGARYTSKKARAISSLPLSSSSNRSKVVLAAGAVATGLTVSYFYGNNITAQAAATPVSASASDQISQQDYFNKYASITQGGEKMMTPEDFLRAISNAGDGAPPTSVDEAKYRVLFHIADVDNTGTISISEFQHFTEIMNFPDAEYMLAFRIFDRDGDGFVSEKDFRHVSNRGFLSSESAPFDLDCEMVKMYFGRGKSKLNYGEFTQLLKDLQQERVRQEFTYYDKDRTGYIPLDRFAHILSGVKLRQMPQYVKDNLTFIGDLNKGTVHEGKISYAQFVACNDMLLHIPSYGRVIRAACERTGKSSITREDFLREASRSTSIEITPLEVDIIYKLFDNDRDGKVSIADFNKVGPHRRDQAHGVAVTPAHANFPHKSFSAAVLESVENFALGAVAGGIGAAAVYPIDLVKTRMQNQRAVDPALRMYKNSFDCFGKVVKNEGVRGLYKGLIPQVIGVAPEKAIKLTVNDLLRGLFEDKSKGHIYFPLEVLAGGGAGMSQVMFTNPLEIVKIRLQVQGEGARSKGVGAVTIIRELGFAGLYKGAGACLLRDIPFSAIYFPTYAKMKELLKDKDGKLSPLALLTAGAVAGIPAAYLVTPADVIKTRLQVKPKAGEQTYTGIRDCFWKILTQEKWTAFFKGGIARVCRSSPQFGVTLLSYEMLQQFFAPHITPRPPTNAPLTAADYAAWRAVPLHKVEDMEKKFGPLTAANLDDEEDVPSK